MSRQTLQCIGTSRKGPSESKSSISTPVDAVCAGEPAPNASVHNKSRPTAKPAPKPAAKDHGVTKTTASRSPKAKLNGLVQFAAWWGIAVRTHTERVTRKLFFPFFSWNRSSTGRNAPFPVQLLKDVTENGSGTAKWPGPAAPAPLESAREAGELRQECPALWPSMAAEECEEQVGSTGLPAASCPVPQRSEGTYDLQADIPGHQSPSEEEEDECGDEDERPARSAPLELLAELDKSDRLISFCQFLKAVMEKDYVLSQKLCLMILIYEPENPEAKLFMPLIEERLLIAQEVEEQRRKEEETAPSSGEEEDDSDDDDDDDDDEDGDGDGDDSDTSEGQTDSSESSSSSSEEDTEEDSEQRSSEEYERCKRATVIP